MRVSTKRRPAVFRTPAASSLIARRSETAIRERVPCEIEIKEKILALVLLIGKNPYPYILIAVFRLTPSEDHVKRRAQGLRSNRRRRREAQSDWAKRP